MNILQIELLSNNLEATERFYAQTMGLPIAHKTDGTLTFLAGSSLLTFNHTDETPVPIYHFAFNIPSNKLEEALAWVKTFAEPIQVPAGGVVADFQSWNARAVYFFDNNGNLVELIARFDLNNANDQPFGPSDILNVSEMGIVADEVTALREKLLQQHQLTHFSKMQPLEDFAALGNDEGLLILAKTNRNWFPTTKPAQKSSVKIRLMHGRLFHEIALQ
jgi:catechol 2,3-dioxygenase-like lactoylglutathione lyase family enzyme